MSPPSEHSDLSEWGRWGVHVLKELERLNESYLKLADEVASLKTFRVQALTVFALVQAAVAAVSFILRH